MYKLTNLTNSPFDIQSLNGPVLLPARSEVEAAIADDYAKALQAFGQVAVESVEHKKRGRPRKESVNGCFN